jgi:hypothetical protein
MHRLKDAQLIKTLALPAAGASAFTEALDLLQGPDQEAHFEVELTLPDLPSLADAKSVTMTLKDSEDGVTFNPVAALAPLTVTGAGGNGSAAVTRKLRIPSDTKRYLRADVAVEAAGGDNTAKAFTLALVF